MNEKCNRLVGCSKSEARYIKTGPPPHDDPSVRRAQRLFYMVTSVLLSFGC